MPSARLSDHPTNSVRLLDKGTRDLGDMWALAYKTEGFSRVWLRPNSAGGTIVMFKSIRDAQNAIVQWRRTGTLEASHVIPPNVESEPAHTAAPSTALYIRLMKGMTNEAMEKILRGLKGLTYLKFADNNVKAYFDTEASATHASDKLYQTTNIFSFYWHPPHADDDSAASGSQPSKGSSHSRTLHISKLDRDLADLRAYFYTLPEPPTRIGFHRGYVFLVFDTAKDADAAMEHMQNDRNTRMIPRKVEMDYAPHFVPCPIGKPLKSIMISYLTIDPNAEEMERFFSGYKGFVTLDSGKKACFATFASEAEATVALEDLNNVTNLKAVYRVPEFKDGTLKAGNYMSNHSYYGTGNHKHNHHNDKNGDKTEKQYVAYCMPTSSTNGTKTSTQSPTTTRNAKVASAAAVSPSIRTSSKSYTSAERAAAVLKSLEKKPLEGENPFELLEGSNGVGMDEGRVNGSKKRNSGSSEDGGWTVVGPPGTAAPNGNHHHVPVKVGGESIAKAAEDGNGTGNSSNGAGSAGSPTAPLNAKARRAQRRALATAVGGMVGVGSDGGGGGKGGKVKGSK
ncbi:hypothetical protein HDV00_011841 [Rhizophlyctis rosea]|nr:hypothetical protein HDV00_011841 [Rhizophlyctis rosea]